MSYYIPIATIATQCGLFMDRQRPTFYSCIDLKKNCGIFVLRLRFILATEDYCPTKSTPILGLLVATLYV